MNISITARHLRITEEMKDFARERAERMWKYFDRIGTIEVVLDVDGQKYTAEILVTATRHTQCVGRAKHEDIHAALDRATEKVERQLTKFKEKLKAHRSRKDGAQATPAAEAAEAGPAAEEEDWW